MIRPVISVVEHQFRELIRVLDFHEHINALKQVPKCDIESPNVRAFESMNRFNSLLKTDAPKNRKPFRFEILQQIFREIEIRPFVSHPEVLENSVLQQILPFYFLLTGKCMTEVLQLKLKHIR